MADITTDSTLKTQALPDRNHYIDHAEMKALTSARAKLLSKGMRH